MTYQIEDGIPIPPCPSRGRGGARRQPKKPWSIALDALQPGQSVLTTEYADLKRYEQFRLWRPERKFVSRKVVGQGWRVWRTE